jgi:hypothetical protein
MKKSGDFIELEYWEAEKLQLFRVNLENQDPKTSLPFISHAQPCISTRSSK